MYVLLEVFWGTFSLFVGVYGMQSVSWLVLELGML